MESHSHANLKRLALDFLLAQGCCAAAIEVACPISRYRIDAAGFVDKLPARVRPGPAPRVLFPRAAGAATVLIECKCSRADFLRDQRALPDLLRRRDHLLRALERNRSELVRVMEPHLRRSDGFLFAEMESWDFSRSRLHSHRAIVRALRQIDRKLYSETKFFMIAQYRLGARLFILAPRGMLRPREVPAGWGLLELDRAGDIRLAADAPRLEPSERSVHRTLRNIAVAATRDHRGAVVRRSITPGASLPGRDARSIVVTRPAASSPTRGTPPSPQAG